MRTTMQLLRELYQLDLSEASKISAETRAAVYHADYEEEKQDTGKKKKKKKTKKA